MIHEMGSRAERGMKDAKIRWDLAEICSRANNRKREAKNQEKTRDDQFHAQNQGGLKKKELWIRRGG